MWTLALLLPLALCQPTDSAPPVAPRSDLIPKLIAQLGGRKFKDRESATQELNALGAAALPALRQAAQTKDPEIRQRAEVLVRQIEQRVEAAQLLEPKRIHLAYTDVPLVTAVTDLGNKTGLDLRLEG